VKPFLAILTAFVASLGMFVIGLAFAGWLLYVDAVRQPAPSVDVADLWTAEPRKVDRARQHLERVPTQAVDRPQSSDRPPSSDPQPAQPKVAAPAAAITPTPVDAELIDTVTTASVQVTGGEGAREDRLPSAESEGEVRSGPSDQLSISHMEWCSIRYRSYRPEDNSYTSYNGGQQPCVSPYSRDPAREEAASTLGAAPVVRAYPDADAYDSEPAFLEEASPVQYAADDGAYAGSDRASYCFSRYRSYRPEDNSYQPFGGGPRRECE
jgi:hypothetical protein